MGRAKELMMQQQEQGWNFVDEGLTACEQCVVDPTVKQWVAQNHADGPMCLCNGSSSKVVSVNDLFAFINDELIRPQYEDPANVLPWDGREGGYQGTVLSSMDLVDDLALFENEKLANIFVEAFSDSQYTPRE